MARGPHDGETAAPPKEEVRACPYVPLAASSMANVELFFTSALSLPHSSQERFCVEARQIIESMWASF